MISLVDEIVGSVCSIQGLADSEPAATAARGLFTASPSNLASSFYMRAVLSFPTADPTLDSSSKLPMMTRAPAETKLAPRPAVSAT